VVTRKNVSDCGAKECFLAGRIAVVTGGFAGIGLAIAQEFVRRSASVAIGARRGSDAGVCGAVERKLTATGVGTLAGELDVRRSASVGAFVSNVEATLGPVDILVNAAGITAHSTVCGHTTESWRQVIDTNLTGPFEMIRACLPGMIARRWGRIVNIASTAAHTAVADHAAYCASKSGLLGLTRAVALEGAPHGVTCVAISPTWVETEMLRESMRVAAEKSGRSIQEEIDCIGESNPQRRIVQADEIAGLAAFLCSDAARGVTMEDIQVSGGALW